MSTMPWDRIEALYAKARTVPPEDRAAFLRAECDNPEVRAEVSSLLGAREEALDFFASADERLVRPWVDAFEHRPGKGSGPVDRPALTGQNVGRYRLVEEIGVGGMGVVYRATRRGADFDQTVAVKLLQRRLPSGDAEARFRAERRVLAELDHPNIARFLDGGVTEGGRPYLVMEYVDGVPITEYADANDLALEARLDLLEQVFDAVQAAHRKLVVHRDLKPTNVLVAETDAGVPRVKLLDFGIAKLLDDALPVPQPDTRTGQHLMTPAYAAPEQVSGREITTATDVYQLGVLAYELLAGTRPFDLSDASLTEVERIVLEQTPTAPSEKADRGGAEFGGDLDTIVMKCLRKEPERRYRSVEALDADVDRLRSGQPVEARSSTFRYRAKKFLSRHTTSVAGISVFLLLAISFTIFHVRRISTQRAIAERERDRAQAEAQSAQRLSGFLVDLFEASHPRVDRGESLTARDLLRRGQTRLDDLEGQPAVRARILDAMGRAHQGLGNYETADSLLQKALAIRRSHFDNDHLSVARTLLLLSRVESDAYYRKEALTYARKAHSIVKRNHPPRSRTDSLLTATVLRQLGAALQNSGAPDTAHVHLRRALALYRAVSGNTDASLRSTRATLAQVLRSKGEYSAAEKIYRDLLDHYRARGDSFGVARVLNNLGYALRSQGRLRTAEQFFREALSLNERLRGSAHPKTLLVRGNNLTTVLRAQDDFWEMETVLREQLRVVRDRYAADHWRVAKWAGWLGETLVDQGEHLNEACRLLRERVRIYSAADNVSAGYMARARATQGHCLILNGQGSRAYPLLSESHSTLSSDSVRNPVGFASARIGLGLYHRRRGNFDRAETFLTAAHESLESLYGSLPGSEMPHRPVRRLRIHLADLYEEWGKPEKEKQYRTAATQSEPAAETNAVESDDS